ncbi:MAG: DUF1441 family protein [Pseudomonadales bacterium]|nr:DUF1441 family protein [Pseudomonadales bacterium]
MKNQDDKLTHRLKNITQIALILSIHRDTVRRHIQVNRVQPASIASGKPLYDFAEVAKAIYSPSESEQKEANEVAGMSPDEAIKHYNAELAQLKFKNNANQHCHVDEVRTAWNEIRSSLIGVIESFPETVEVKDNESRLMLTHITVLCESLMAQLSEASGVPANAEGS